MKFTTEFDFVDLTGQSFSFKTLRSLKTFLKKESDFWSKKNDEIQSKYSISSQYLTAFTQIDSALTFIESWGSAISSWDEATLNQKLTDLKSNYLNLVARYWIQSGHTFINAWLSCYRYSKLTGDSFIDLLLGKPLNNQSNFEAFRGQLLAYEFFEQDESFIIKRRAAERQSFDVIKSQLLEDKNNLVDEVDGFKGELNSWRDDTKNNLSDWLVDQKGKYDDDVSSWNQSLEDIKTKYQEKLRFDGPAKYWKDSAKRLKEQGNNYIITVVVISAIFLLCLGTYFHSWLQGHPSSLNLQSLEGVVLFASFLSGFAILIRTFSRLAFSSFHLQRDAEEREQLTHLYLSLANETSVDEESRKIVLQALFSRSDTGLLANDSSPTMPGIKDIASLIGKK